MTKQPTTETDHTSDANADCSQALAEVQMNEQRINSTGDARHQRVHSAPRWIHYSPSQSKGVRASDRKHTLILCWQSSN